jgi:predicted metal-dependent hydrolase
MIEYNEEQQEAVSKLHSAWAYVEGVIKVFKFMEERYGIVNTHVIDFRKEELPKAWKRIEDAREEFRRSGADRVLMQKLNEKYK